MTSTVRLEAIGERGEACIIVKQSSPDLDEPQVPVFTLASGERLRPTGEGEFETLDGQRKFRLRQA